MGKSIPNIDGPSEPIKKPATMTKQEYAFKQQVKWEREKARDFDRVFDYEMDRFIQQYADLKD